MNEYEGTAQFIDLDMDKYTVMKAKTIDEELLLMKAVAYYCELYHRAKASVGAEERHDPRLIFCSATLLCAKIAGVLDNEMDCTVSANWWDKWQIDREELLRGWKSFSRVSPAPATLRRQLAKNM